MPYPPGRRCSFRNAIRLETGTTTPGLRGWAGQMGQVCSGLGLKFCSREQQSLSPGRAQVPTRSQHMAKLGEVNQEGKSLERSKWRLEPALHLCLQMLPLRLIHLVPKHLSSVCSSHSITLHPSLKIASANFVLPAPAGTSNVSKMSRLSTRVSSTSSGRSDRTLGRHRSLIY